MSIQNSSKDEIPKHRSPRPLKWNPPEISEVPRGPERWKKEDLFKVPRPKEMFEASPSHHRGSSSKVGRKVLLFSWMAAAVDSFICLALTAFFLALSGVVLNSEFAQVYEVVFSWEFAPFLAFGFSVLIYMVALRSFTARTLGDWAWGLRLGGDHDFVKYNYGLKVLLRILVLFATGLILIPIMSMIFGRDIAGIVCGLKLQVHQR